MRNTSTMNRVDNQCCDFTRYKVSPDLAESGSLVEKVRDFLLLALNRVSKRHLKWQHKITNVL